MTATERAKMLRRGIPSAFTVQDPAARQVLEALREAITLLVGHVTSQVEAPAKAVDGGGVKALEEGEGIQIESLGGGVYRLSCTVQPGGGGGGSSTPDLDNYLLVENGKLTWDEDAVADGVLTHDYSGSATRDWDAEMPGIKFKHPGGVSSGLTANLESGADAGPRLDMGWGGTGGGNFELYSKTHGTRPGEFRIIYGGGDYGRVIFTHYDGTNWKVFGGLSKEGRFVAGLTDAVFPGISGSDAGGTLAAPAYPFQVYNEGTVLRGYLDKEGVMVVRRNASADEPADADLVNSSFALYQQAGVVKVKVKDASGTTLTHTLGSASIPDGTALGQILYWDTTSPAGWKVAKVGTLAAGDMLKWDGSKFVKLTPVEVTVVTASRYNKVDHRFEIKTRSVTALAAGSESGWTAIDDGTLVAFPQST